MCIIFFFWFLGQYDIEYKVWIVTREQDVFILEKNIQGELIQKSFYIREFPFDVICCGNQVKINLIAKNIFFLSGDIAQW